MPQSTLRGTFDIGPFVNVDAAPLVVELHADAAGFFWAAEGYGAVDQRFPHVGLAIDDAVATFSA